MVGLQSGGLGVARYKHHDLQDAFKQYHQGHGRGSGILKSQIDPPICVPGAVFDKSLEERLIGRVVGVYSDGEDDIRVGIDPVWRQSPFRIAEVLAHVSIAALVSCCMAGPYPLASVRCTSWS